MEDEEKGQSRKKKKTPVRAKAKGSQPVCTEELWTVRK